MIYVLTPAFCKADLLADLFAHLRETPAGCEVTHVVSCNHYPVDKRRNRERIREIALDFGAVYVDHGRDLGSSAGVNAALRAVGFGPGDIVMNLDPDDRPSAGYAAGLAAAAADPAVAVACSFFWVIDQRVAEGKLVRDTAGGLEVWRHDGNEMWQMAAARYEFLHAAGGAKSDRPMYGGNETAMTAEWKRLGLKCVYVPAVRSDAAPVDKSGPMFDPEYRAWKDAHLQGFAGGFEDWLRAAGLKHLIGD